MFGYVYTIIYCMIQVSYHIQVFINFTNMTGDGQQNKMIIVATIALVLGDVTKYYIHIQTSFAPLSAPLLIDAGLAFRVLGVCAQFA